MSLKTEMESISDPKILEALECGLDDATAYHRQVGDIHNPGITFKELSELLPPLINRLEMVAMGRGTPEQNFSRICQAVERLPPKLRMYFDSIDPVFCFSEPMDPVISRFEQLAKSLSSMPEDECTKQAEILKGLVRIFQNDMNTPGKGGANKRAKLYVMGISMLARRFKEVLPQHAISDDENSLFYRYVYYWMSERMEIDSSPDRHIKNAIADMKQWREIPL
jgi:hypothetical protein